LLPPQPLTVEALRRPLEFTQYLSIRSTERLAEAGAVTSVGSRGDSFDNAVTESFFAILECELLDRTRFATRTQARTAVFDYLEGFYNRIRRHSTLGYLSPAEYERRHPTGYLLPDPASPKVSTGPDRGNSNHPLQQDHDMPIRARHRRRLRAAAAALLGAVAGGALLVACSAANPPPAAPPATTRPAPSPAPTSTAGARGPELGIFEVSCHTGKGITASGRPSSRETVSVDPSVVPLGTRLVIDKVGPRVAADTGGAIRGRRLDIWEPSAAACTRFGRRQLRVWQAP
jgi:3D (Asp-Asp-Asp) domain-containing protein